jgi:thymidine kinase
MSLKLIMGCMYSGKTTEILRIVNSLKHINEIPIIIKPIFDNRYSKNKISTHTKQQYDCLTLNSLNEFDNPFHKKYIIIEEAQFFENLYEFVLKQVDEKNKHVIVVGLDGDSNRENFGDIHKLIPICDEIVKLKAYCSICKNGTPGIFSKRLSEKKEKVLVGSDGDYIAVCRKCYLNNS